MKAPQDRHLWPHALYFDTNALLAAGPLLRVGWLDRLRSLAKEGETRLCVPQPVVAEYIAELTRGAQRKIRQLNGLTDDINRLLARGSQRPSFPNGEYLAHRIDQIQRARLTKAGYGFTPTARLELDTLLHDAIEHVPPFQAHDKGFRDAVIIESIKSDALTNFDKPNIFIISADREFGAGLARLRSAGIKVDCVGPGDKAPKVFGAALTSARHKMLEDTRSALLEHLRDYEGEFVRVAKRVQVSSASFAFLDVEELRDVQVSGVRRATPLGISWVDLTPADIEWNPSPGKRAIRVGVDFEFELTVTYRTPSTILLSGPSKRIAEIGEGDQESMLVDQFSSGLTLESTLGFNVLPEQRRITLSVTVEAEIDEAGFDKRQFGGLRIVSPNDT